MNTVKFNVVNEFIHELKKQYPLGAAAVSPAPILRLTGQMKVSGSSPNIKHFSIVATFLSHDEPGAIILLDYYCGDLWGIPPKDDPVIEAGEKAKKDIELAAGILGIEVRAGVYE